MIKTVDETSPNIASRELPTMLMKKLNTSVPNGLTFTDRKIAENLMNVKEPQNTAVILAPICRERCRLDLTENVAKYIAYVAAVPL